MLNILVISLLLLNTKLTLVVTKKLSMDIFNEYSGEISKPPQLKITEIPSIPLWLNSNLNAPNFISVYYLI